VEDEIGSGDGAAEHGFISGIALHQIDAFAGQTAGVAAAAHQDADGETGIQQGVDEMPTEQACGAGNQRFVHGVTPAVSVTEDEIMVFSSFLQVRLASFWESQNAGKTVHYLLGQA
jgi:hypothetical protein